MIAVHILEPHDTIRPDDWIRPLELHTMSGGMSDVISTRNPYSGHPQNHVQWVQVRHVLGPCWYGKTVREYVDTLGYPHEFVRGAVPSAHQLEYGG